MQIDKTVMNIPPVIKNVIKTEGTSIGVKTEEVSVKDQVLNSSSNELSDKMAELKKFAANENKPENNLTFKKRNTGKSREIKNTG